jgi:hypothetical protein
MKLITGNHIKIHEYNDFFGHVTIMLLDHFDKPEYDKYLFILGTYTQVPAKYFKDQFPDHKIIVYQLEQLMGLYTWQSVPVIIENIKSADEIWDYDKLNVHYLMEHSIKVDRLVPLLYSSKLERIERKENPEIDVLFYGLINERRFKIFQLLQSQLYGRIKLAWIYGDSEIDKHLANTKVVLNLHATEPWNRQEQVRLFYPIINGITCVSEPSQVNNMPDEIIETSIENLSNTLYNVCYSDEWKSFGTLAKSKFQNRSREYLISKFNCI